MKFKKLTLLVLVLSITLTSTTGCWVLWAKYKNRQYGFSILLPRFWKRTTGEQGTLIMAKAPLRGKNDKFQENINVVVSELPAAVDIVMYIEMNQKEAMELVPGPKVDFADGEIFAGLNRGRWFAFTALGDDLSTRIMSAVWIKGGTKAFVVSCSAEASLFDKYEPTFRKIMQSLRY
jgi:hypothetical protein